MGHDKSQKRWFLYIIVVDIKIFLSDYWSMDWYAKIRIRRDLNSLAFHVEPLPECLRINQCLCVYYMLALWVQFVNYCGSSYNLWYVYCCFYFSLKIHLIYLRNFRQLKINGSMILVCILHFVFSPGFSGQVCSSQ